jgi:hypothetical protein
VSILWKEFLFCAPGNPHLWGEHKTKLLLIESADSLRNSSFPVVFSQDTVEEANLARCQEDGSSGLLCPKKAELPSDNCVSGLNVVRQI